ncbi:SSUH2-like protein, partial [Mya arenaria]
YPDATEGDVQLEWKGNVPDDDVDEDFESSPAPPSAPPLEKMDPVPGYNHIGAGGFMAPPPAYEAVMREQPTREQILGADIINENDAREVLLQHVAEHCCYGSRAAKQLKFTELEHTSAFHYKLETFAEGRTTEWTFVPYTGAEFTDHVKQIEVPHTSSVKLMLWKGLQVCNETGGPKETQLHLVSWKRKTQMSDMLRQWNDNMYSLCGPLSTEVFYTTQCEMLATLPFRSNHIDDHVVERTELPNDLIKKVTGHVAFNETQFRRHHVQIVPVTQALYRWKNVNSDFFVYGYEKKVYAPKYPQQCCCGCSLL